MWPNIGALSPGFKRNRMGGGGIIFGGLAAGVMAGRVVVDRRVRIGYLGSSTPQESRSVLQVISEAMQPIHYA